MANGKTFFNQLDHLLITNDLTEVKLKMFKAPNDTGKLTTYIQAEWEEPRKKVNKAGTGFEYVPSIIEKTEEVNKYFSPELFVMGIAQRKAFIKAGYDKQVEAYKNGLMHPAMYKEA